ncbi:MAG: SOUL family heme-binding protein [Oligoflexia bacterium]
MSPLSAFAIEKPVHQVLEAFKFEGAQIEIRNYQPYVVAETVVEAASLDAASNEGFKRLAGYIFGGNRRREVTGKAGPGLSSATGSGVTDGIGPEKTAQKAAQKLEMTAPVGAIGPISGGGKFMISFVMPSQYTLETLPVPDDSRIVLRQLPARKVAAVIFSGRWTEANFKEHSELLLKALKSRGIDLVAGTELQVARYNAPFTPWFLRHNEIQAVIF